MENSTTPMTIKIDRHPDDADVCTVRIDNNISPVDIETTLAIPIRRWGMETDFSKAEEWVRKIKNSPDKIIGISCEYENNNYITSSTPYDLVQLCVGNQCLLFDPCNSKKSVPKALKDVVSSGRFTVVGVGMEEVAKKLEENLGLKISRARDLREMAAGLGYDVGDSCDDKKKKQKKEKKRKLMSVVRLARRVLGEEWTKWTNRNGINWWEDEEDDDEDWSTLSDDKVKYGTLDAFLAFKMGKHLIQKMFA